MFNLIDGELLTTAQPAVGVCPCSCGEDLLFYFSDEGNPVRFQHGQNPEHSITGEVQENHGSIVGMSQEPWKFWISIKPPAGSEPIPPSQTVIELRGSWLDAIHARMAGL